MPVWPAAGVGGTFQFRAEPTGREGVQETFRIALQGFGVAFTVALIAVPLCMKLARVLNVVDHPGGRKQHEKVTPLLGGAAVFAAFAVGLFVVESWSRSQGSDLRLGEIRQVLFGGLVLFGIGLVDDYWKDTLGFLPKLAGQVIGVMVMTWPQPYVLFTGDGTPQQWAYFVFMLLWYLTIVNSFNFSDNMNGLMSGLSIVAFSASVIYLGSMQSIRTMLISSLLLGGLLGFLPFNFPRSRIFLGDAGSMFVGYWMAWVLFSMSKGVLAEGLWDFGFQFLIPAILIVGVPLYDAAFVVIRRFIDKRPVYLGDDQHLSHRLVRAGFPPTEAVVILWGAAIVLAGVGTLAAMAETTFRYVLLVASLLVLIAGTNFVMAIERTGLHGNGGPGPGDDDEGPAGSDAAKPRHRPAGSAS